MSKRCDISGTQKCYSPRAVCAIHTDRYYWKKMRKNVVTPIKASELPHSKEYGEISLKMQIAYVVHS